MPVVTSPCGTLPGTAARAPSSPRFSRTCCPQPPHTGSCSAFLHGGVPSPECLPPPDCPPLSPRSLGSAPLVLVSPQEGDRTPLFIFPLMRNQLFLVSHLLLGAGEGRTLTRTGIPGGRRGIRSGQGVWWHQQLPGGLPVLCCPPHHGRRSRRGPRPLPALMSAAGTSPDADCPGAAGSRGGRTRWSWLFNSRDNKRSLPSLRLSSPSATRCRGAAGGKRGAGTPGWHPKQTGLPLG